MGDATRASVRNRGEYDRIVGNCAVVAVAACLCPPAYAADASDDQRSDIVVTGQRALSQAGAKSDVLVAEEMQSMSVITSGDLVDLGLVNLNQALRRRRHARTAWCGSCGLSPLCQPDTSSPPRAQTVDVVPDKNGRKTKSKRPMDDAGPGPHDLTPDIVEHVAAYDQEPKNGAQGDAGDTLMRMRPALGNMRDEHAADAEQGGN